MSKSETKSRTVVLIGGGKVPRGEARPARELYSWSRLFQDGMQFAEKIGADLCIVSAHGGLLDPDDLVIPPATTKYMRHADRHREWGRSIVTALRQRWPREQLSLLVLAPRVFVGALLLARQGFGELVQVTSPPHGLDVDGRRQWLREESARRGHEWKSGSRQVYFSEKLGRHVHKTAAVLADRSARGLCSWCGERPPRLDRKTCEVCVPSRAAASA